MNCCCCCDLVQPEDAFTVPKLAMVVQVVELMGEEKGWWYWKRQRELKRARAFLQTFTSDAAAPGKKSAAPQEGTDLISSHNKGGGA